MNARCPLLRQMAEPLYNRVDRGMSKGGKGGKGSSKGGKGSGLAFCPLPDANLWDSALRQQIYLGDEDFVERMQALVQPRNSIDPDIPKVQRRKARTLAQWLASCENREEALYRAHTQSALSMSAIARELGLSVSRVSRLIARVEGAKGKA